MRRTPGLAARKTPRQARARQMHEDILEGAIRVLEKDGPLRFTTIRVAEAAGISVGSLYQYYPNKESLLLALHEREMQRAWIDVCAILDDERRSPARRLGAMIDYFFRAEAEESAAMRAALSEAEAYFRDSGEYRKLRRVALDKIAAFLRDALPGRPRRAALDFEADVIVTVTERVGSAIALRELPPAAVARWSRTCAELLTMRLGLNP